MIKGQIVIALNLGASNIFEKINMREKYENQFKKLFLQYEFETRRIIARRFLLQ